MKLWFNLKARAVPQPGPSPHSPQWPEGDWLATFASLFCVTAAFGTIVATYVCNRWRVWFDAACSEAFNKTDSDGSGRIDKNELYVGVLQTYLSLHKYGLNVRAPPKEDVLILMEVLDVDKSGEMDQDEFKRLLEILVMQTGGRIITQIGLTILCPMTAAHICASMRWIFTSATLVAGMSVSPCTLNFCSHLPSNLDESITTGILMLCINPALSIIDRCTERVAQATSRTTLNK